MIYQGSKSRLAKYIVPIINKILHKNKIDTFVDACCGGANVIANPKHPILCANKIGYDKNKYLIALLNKFKNENVEFVEITEQEYKKVRDNFDAYDDWYVGYVGFFATFGGAFFNGYGREKKISRVKKCYKNIMKQQKALTNATFVEEDFFNLSLKDTLIYIDPPYKNSKKFKVPFDYDKFWDKAQELAENNIVLISEQTIHDDIKCDILFKKPLTMTIAATGEYAERNEYLIRLK